MWDVFAAAALALVSPADTQTVDGGSAERCELHVWPGSGLSSIYSGWFHGGIVNGAVTGRDGYPTVPTEPIDTVNQVELLKAAKLNILIQQPNSRVIYHDVALPSRTIRTATTRIDPSTAPCYAEFIVDDVFFQQDIVNGSFLKVLFRYRAFGTGATPDKTFGTWVKTRLLLLPPKPDTDMAAAATEVRSAFSNNVKLFAAALLKPAKNKR
ncbi:hypothetical protein AB5I39_00210 [Sphingomonas sp. MMS24-J45]|uniref:hypothetical protein n=1 Tax=Sphingomonas sp. MMS24-J45 TaxID=3238806 RepID=UPI00385113EE